MNYWKIIFIIFIISITGCTTKTIHVVDQQQFAIMYKSLAPLLWEKNIVDKNGFYQEQIKLCIKQNLPCNVGEYLFQYLPLNFISLSTQNKSLTFAQSKNLHSKIAIEPYGFSFQDNKRIIQVKLIAQTNWYNNGDNDWILLYHVSSLLGHPTTTYYLILSPNARENLPIKPELIAICDESTSNCTIFTTDPLDKTQNFGTSFFEAEPGIYSIIACPEGQNIQKNRGTDITSIQLKK